MKKEAQLTVFIIALALLFTLISQGYFGNLTGKVSEEACQNFGGGICVKGYIYDFALEKNYNKENFRTTGQYHFIASYYEGRRLVESYNLALSQVVEDYGKSKVSIEVTDTKNFICQDALVWDECKIGHIVFTITDAEPYSVDETRKRGDGRIELRVNKGGLLNYVEIHEYRDKLAYQEYEFNNKKYKIDGKINVDRSWNIRYSIDNGPFSTWQGAKDEEELIQLSDGTKIKILNIYVGKDSFVEFIFV